MNRKGYTLLKILVAIACIAISLLLLTGILNHSFQLKNTSYISEDILGIRQLRLLLAQSYHTEVDEDKLTFRYHGNEAKLASLRDHTFLVRQEGYIIYLKDLDAIHFNKRAAKFIYIGGQTR